MSYNQIVRVESSAINLRCFRAASYREIQRATRAMCKDTKENKRRKWRASKIDKTLDTHNPYNSSGEHYLTIKRAVACMIRPLLESSLFFIS